MLEPSSSEDENETTGTLAELDDTSSALSGLSSQRDSGRQSQNTNPSQNQLHPSLAMPRSVSPCVEPAQPAVCSAQQQQYLTDKFLPARASLAHIRATSPNPPELMQEPTSTEEPVEDETEKAEREEAERKSKLQLYVLVLRCIAYPFNAKQQTDLSRRPIKITLSQLEQINVRFQCFLRGELSITADESFNSAVYNYSNAFLKSNRLHNIVASGACSAFDFREVFRRTIEKRVKSLPEVEGITKESIMSQWLTKFDAIFRGFDEAETKKLTGTKIQQYHQQQQQNLASETILSKEQLYDMFQNILKIKKFEHQLLYNALQVSASSVFSLDGLRCTAQ